RATPRAPFVDASLCRSDPRLFRGQADRAAAGPIVDGTSGPGDGGNGSSCRESRPSLPSGRPRAWASPVSSRRGPGMPATPEPRGFLERLLIPPSLLLGAALAFLACCLAGRLKSDRNPFPGFQRFHWEI